MVSESRLIRAQSTYTCCSSIHARAETRHDSADHHLGRHQHQFRLPELE
jgi:hypothetical protein